MADRPILFSTPMVRALIEGRKTQTRRLLKIQGHMNFSQFGPSDTRGYDWHLRDKGMRWHDLRDSELRNRLPFQVGDRLWVRETWTASMTHGWTIADARSRMYGEEILYKADGHGSVDGWWPSIFLPREFSRLTLTVTDMRVQRLQEISEADAKAEGANAIYAEDGQIEDERHHRWGFINLWDSLNAKRGYGWEANPWVVALTFTVEHRRIGGGA